jgi:hypothetical protein
VKIYSGFGENSFLRPEEIEIPEAIRWKRIIQNYARCVAKRYLTRPENVRIAIIGKRNPH